MFSAEHRWRKGGQCVIVAGHCPLTRRKIRRASASRVTRAQVDVGDPIAAEASVKRSRSAVLSLFSPTRPFQSPFHTGRGNH